MKKLFLISLFIFLLGETALSKETEVSKYDILTLVNGKSFEGNVIKVKPCQIVFKVKKKKFEIPAKDIFSIKFADPNDPKYKNYLELDDPDKCMKGQVDAEMFHGKAGLHIFLGALFGPLAMLGVAAGDPSPSNGNSTYLMSENKNLFSDPNYLMCYKKKAKGKNFGNTGIGWAAGFLLLLIMTAGEAQ